MAYEDPTGFSDIVDTNGKMTETSTRVTVSGLFRQSEAWCADDKGVGHFNGDFDHIFEAYWNYIDAWELYGQWVVANVANDQAYCIANSANFVHVRAYSDNGTYIFLLNVRESGSTVGSDQSVGLSLSTLYYVTVSRDYDGGTGGANSYAVYIRTGSHTGTLQDTLTAENSSGVQYNYRYVYMCQSNDSGTGNDLGAYVQNLDLQEGAIQALSGTISAAGTVSGALSATRKLVGSTAALSSISGALSATKKLAGSSAGQSNVSGGLKVARKLAGSSAGQSNVSGGLVSMQGQIGLAGLIGAQSQVSATCKAARAIAGAIQASASADATASMTRKVAGTITATNSIAGTISTLASVSGAIAGQSTISGGLAVTMPLVGEIQAGSDLSGLLVIQGQISVAAIFLILRQSTR